MKRFFSTPKNIFVLGILISFVISSGITLIFFPEFEDLIAFFYYVLLSNTFVGIPHEPLFIYFGKIYPIYVPLAISIIPTILGCALDYIILTPVLGSKFLKRALKSKMLRKASYYFKKSPFLTLFLFALLPLPFYPVRILSVVTKYPFKRFVTSITLGRIPRYTILALGGMTLNVPDWVIVFLFIFMIAGPLLVKYIRKMIIKISCLISGKKVVPQETADDEDVELSYSSSDSF